MTPDRWLEIKEKVKQLPDFKEGHETDEERREDIEVVEFSGPTGKMKLEWITRPKVLDKQTHYSRRIGSDVQVDYVYSEDEFTHTLKVYQEDLNGEWQEIKAGSGFSF